MSLNLNIKGNSGCIIDVHNNIVTKTVSNIDNNSRLEAQCRKQSDFEKTKIFRAPNIYNYGIKNRKYFFDMEFIPYKTYDKVFNIADKQYLDNICYKLLSFIKENSYGFKLVSNEIIIEKFELTKNKIHKQHNVDLSYLSKLFYNLNNELNLPSGYCHGDLTFSNMLFDKEDIVLIDFLDTYFDSPIQDIVKLRQDTKYYWSLMMTTDYVDKLKMKQCFSYIDNKLHSEFSKLEYYNLYYIPFQILNLMRVIPYCTNKDNINFLIKNINKLWQH